MEEEEARVGESDFMVSNFLPFSSPTVLSFGSSYENEKGAFEIYLPVSEETSCRDVMDYIFYFFGHISTCKEEEPHI